MSYSDTLREGRQRRIVRLCRNIFVTFKEVDQKAEKQKNDSDQ